MRLSAAGLAFALAAIGAAGPRTVLAEEQHATAPGLPGQANKDVVVNPSGTLKDSGYGIVVQRDPAPRSTPPPARRSELEASGSPTYALPPPPDGPRGPTVVNASYLTVR